MAERSVFMIWGIILLVVAASLIAGCTSTSTTPAGTQTPIVKTKVTTEAETQPTQEYTIVTMVPTLSEGTDVKISHKDFDPRTLVVMNGTTVTWTNEDETDYSVVSDTGTPESFHSGKLSKGGIFKFKFSKPGTYMYHSSLPPEITGMIVVL